MIFNENTLVSYLVKKLNKEPKPEKEMAIEFVREFNKESNKQNSKWFAEFEEHRHKGFDEGKPFILLHVKKRIAKGWWIFKEIISTSIHVGCYEHHYSFVRNDYMTSGYGKEDNEEIFRLLPEIKPLLEKMPLAFSILEDYSESAMTKRIVELEEDIIKLEERRK